MTEFDKYERMTKLAGCDEVGRGPLIGDVVTAAVILDPAIQIEGLADSKKLSEKKREQLFDQIINHALFYSVGRASPQEIDELNILHATMLAMKRAVEGLSVVPEMVLFDGNRCPDSSIPSQAIVKGDAKVKAISAASIVAKVIRDREMHTLHALHPEYGFDKHKGYPTKAHLEALQNHGVLAQHRKSFKPVKLILENS